MFEQETRRVAVLIDAENVPAIYADRIMENAESLGKIVMKEMYGSGPALCSWTEPALRYVLRPNITLRQTKGKNTSDIALTIGAMDLLVADIADDVVIVSSDSDFSALAIRLRTAGKSVIGMGEAKSNAMWKVACSKFITLENKNVPAAEPVKVKQEPAIIAPKQPEPDIDFEDEALRIIRTDGDQNGFITIDLLIQKLREEHPDLLSGKRVMDKTIAALESSESFDIRKEKRQGRRTPLLLIREHVEEVVQPEVQKEKKTEDPTEMIREKISKMMEEKHGHIPISAMFPVLGRISGYRSMQRRSGKKPQQFLIDSFGDLFDTEDINGGLWAIPKGEATAVGNSEAETAQNAVDSDENVSVIEQSTEVAAEAGTAEETVPFESDIRDLNKEATDEGPALKLTDMLIADSWDAEIASKAAVIMTENKPLQAYNMMRRSFGNKEGGEYYNAIKAYLKKL